MQSNTFWIKGKRYENLKHADGSYIKLFNKSWVRAKKSERPKQFLKLREERIGNQLNNFLSL